MRRQKSTTSNCYCFYLGDSDKQSLTFASMCLGKYIIAWAAAKQTDCVLPIRTMLSLRGGDQGPSIQ